MTPPDGRPRCGYRVEAGLYAPLECGQQAGHSGPHIDFRPNVSIGFGRAAASGQEVHTTSTELQVCGDGRRPYEDLLRFIDAVGPFVRDVLDEPFPWKHGGQVTTWMSRAEYDEAAAALEALRD